MSKEEAHKGAAHEVFEKVLSIDSLASALISSIGKERAEELLSEAPTRSSRKQKPPREAYNIQFAQGISTKDMLTLLQYELLRARNTESEVLLPQSIVHDIKFRLGWYLKNHGEVERPVPKRVGAKT